MQQSPADHNHADHNHADHDATDPAEHGEVSGGQASGGQISEGPSGLQSVEGLGGADAVPETPDNVVADRDLDIRSGDGGE